MSKMVLIEGYQKFFSFDVWSIMKTWSSKSTTKIHDCLEFLHVTSLTKLLNCQKCRNSFLKVVQNVYTIIIWNTKNIPWNCKNVQTSMLNHMFWIFFWIKQKLIFWKLFLSTHSFELNTNLRSKEAYTCYIGSNFFFKPRNPHMDAPLKACQMVLG